MVEQIVDRGQQKMGSGWEVMHRGVHMGGGHPRWETEWVGGVGAGPVHRKMKIFECMPV